MSTATSAKGSIPEIIRNDAKVYEGDLVKYFAIVFFQAQNCNCPYHNFRHMLHVTWLCYNACSYYREQLSPRKKRNLLIAALFHDFNHSGMMGDDDLNIQRATRALKRCLADEDKQAFEAIATLIKATEYPYTVASDQLSLAGQIIRDADISQALSAAWIQQVILGLAAEWRTKPIEVLRAQANFLGKLRFITTWAQELFPQRLIDEKIQESKELLALLEAPAAV